MSGLRADQRRVRRVLEMDAFPPQQEDLALPHRRRSGERQERTHLTIAIGLVPEHPELRRRDDPITARRLGTLPHRGDRIPVEPSALHGEIENAVHDRAAMIYAR